MKYFFLCLCFFSFNILALDNQPLPAEKAFVFSATVKNNKTLLMNWHLSANSYLYQHSISFLLPNSQDAKLGKPVFPKTNLFMDYPNLGKVKVYQHELTVLLPLLSVAKKNFLIKVNYQGCSKNGFCYAPITKTLSITLKNTFNSSYAAHVLRNLFIFLGTGLLLSLTPCVLPMVPILSAIIVGQKRPIKSSRSFLLSLTYVFFMALASALLGIIVAVAGSNIQPYFQKPWVIILYSLVFLLMALSLLDWYHVRLPQALTNRLNRMAHDQKHTFVGIAIMGSLSTLVLSPCATPLWVSAILFISQSNQILLGSFYLFVMGIGMGIPLLLLGLIGPKVLPKTGRWMISIKHFLGIMMLAVAIWMLSRILSGKFTLLLWAFLSIGCSLKLGVFSATPIKNKILTLCQKIMGIFLFIYGIICIIGALLGNTDPLRPIYFPRASIVNQKILFFIPIHSMNDLNKQLKSAASLHKPILLDFYADWCMACKIMENTTFADSAVKNVLQNYVLLQVDITHATEANNLLMKKLNVIAPPTILFFNEQGREIPLLRLIGEQSIQKFINHLQIVSTSINLKEK